MLCNAGFWFLVLLPLPLGLPDRVLHQFLEKSGAPEGAGQGQVSPRGLVHVVDELVRSEPAQLALHLNKQDKGRAGGGGGKHHNAWSYTHAFVKNRDGARRIFADHGRGRGRGGVLVCCLPQVVLIVDLASLSRRSTFPTPNRDTSNVWALITLLSIYHIKAVCLSYPRPFSPTVATIYLLG